MYFLYFAESLNSCLKDKTRSDLFMESLLMLLLQERNVLAGVEYCIVFYSQMRNCVFSFEIIVPFFIKIFLFK